MIFLANIVNREILNNSANKKGVTPNSSIGLSHPIKVPSQRTPNKYIVETDIVSFRKIIKKLSFKFIKVDKKQAIKKPTK